MNWFQTDECYDFYKSLPFLEAFKFEVEKDGEVKGRIVGYIQKDGGKLKQFFSRRAIINGGPYLAEDITDAEIAELLEKCKSGLKGKCIYIETRNFDDYDKYKSIFHNLGFIYHPHYDIQVDCTNWEKVEDNIGKHRKKYIRLSLREGATIVKKPTIEQIQEFYSILQDLYNNKIKSPLWPFSFFESLFNNKFGKFFLIELNGRILGGSACVVGGKQSVYEWFACGNDGIYKNVHPSSLVKYVGLKYTSENRIKVFDMMGAGAPGDGGYGVRDFKQEFGGELVEYGRFKYILNRPLYYLGVIGVKILKKI